MNRKTRRTGLSTPLTAPLAALVLAAALNAPAGTAHAYGYAAPMGVIGIEAQAPVGGLAATAPQPEAAPAAKPAATAPGFKTRVRAWVVALKQRLDGSTHVAVAR